MASDHVLIMRDAVLARKLGMVSGPVSGRALAVVVLGPEGSVAPSKLARLSWPWIPDDPANTKPRGGLESA